MPSQTRAFWVLVWHMVWLAGFLTLFFSEQLNKHSDVIMYPSFFRPHSTDSFTHRKMTLSMADRATKTQKIRVLPIAGKDPEAHKTAMIKVRSILWFWNIFSYFFMKNALNDVSGISSILMCKCTMVAHKLDQLQLVPSGGDTGPRGTSMERTFFCHDIRVQLCELKCMELVS
jgi:hypothetical protein